MNDDIIFMCLKIMLIDTTNPHSFLIYFASIGILDTKLNDKFYVSRLWYRDLVTYFFNKNVRLLSSRLNNLFCLSITNYICDNVRFWFILLCWTSSYFKVYRFHVVKFNIRNAIGHIVMPSLCNRPSNQQAIHLIQTGVF